MPEPEDPTRFEPAAVAARWHDHHRPMLDEFCRLVGVEGDGQAPLHTKLRHLAMAYGVDRLRIEERGRAKQQKRVIGQLITSLRRTLEHLSKVESDYAMAIDDIASAGGDRDTTLATLHADTERMLQSAETFLKCYKPEGVKSNFALERAIGALLPFIERDCRQPVKFSENAAMGFSPRPSSDGARALVLFLQAIDPGATATSICNMVERMRSQEYFTPTPLEEIMGVITPTPLIGG